jgi:hypothetical protein
MPGTLAESTTRSLAGRGGSLLPPLAPGAAVGSATPIDNEYCGRFERQVTILTLLLHSITTEVLNDDIVFLATCRARQLCLAAGLTPVEFEEALDRYRDYSAGLRGRNPLSCLF